MLCVDDLRERLRGKLAERQSGEEPAAKAPRLEVAATAAPPAAGLTAADVVAAATSVIAASAPAPVISPPPAPAPVTTPPPAQAPVTTPPPAAGHADSISALQRDLQQSVEDPSSDLHDATKTIFYFKQVAIIFYFLT